MTENAGGGGSLESEEAAIARLKRVCDRLVGHIQDGEEGEAEHDPAFLVESLKRVQQAYKAVKNKAEIVEQNISGSLGVGLNKLIQLKGHSYEDVCREACNFIPNVARGLSYRGTEWAIMIVPQLLERLEDGATINSSAYAAICALASHCYDEEGKVLVPILERMGQERERPMDGTVRRQLYALLKIIIEKWPPPCVKQRMPQLQERLIADIESPHEEYMQAAMHGLVVLSRKWPDDGTGVYQALSREKQTRLARDQPTVKILLTPRSGGKREKSSPRPRSHSTPPTTRSTSSLSSRRRISRLSRRRLGVHPRQLGIGPAEFNGDIDEGTASEQPAESAQERLQNFIKWKAERADSNDAAMNLPISFDLSSEDGSTTSSIKSDGGRHGQVVVRAEELRKRKINMMSPTLRQMLPAELKTHQLHGPPLSLGLGFGENNNNDLMIEGRAIGLPTYRHDADKPFDVHQPPALAAAVAGEQEMISTADLLETTPTAAANQGGSLLERPPVNRNALGELPAIRTSSSSSSDWAQPSQPLQTAQAQPQMLVQWKQQSHSSHARDCSAHSSSSHAKYGGGDENSGNYLGNASSSFPLSSFSSHASKVPHKTVSFSADRVVIESPYEEEGQEDERSMKSAETYHGQKEGRDNEDYEFRAMAGNDEYYDYDEMEDMDLSLSKKNLLGDIAEEEEEDEDADDEKDEDSVVKADLPSTTDGSTPPIERENKRKFLFIRPRSLVLLGLGLLASLLASYLSMMIKSPSIMACFNDKHPVAKEDNVTVHLEANVTVGGEEKEEEVLIKRKESSDGKKRWPSIFSPNKKKEKTGDGKDDVVGQNLPQTAFPSSSSEGLVKPFDPKKRMGKGRKRSLPSDEETASSSTSTSLEKGGEKKERKKLQDKKPRFRLFHGIQKVLCRIFNFKLVVTIVGVSVVCALMI